MGRRGSGRGGTEGGMGRWRRGRRGGVGVDEEASFFAVPSRPFRAVRRLGICNGSSTRIAQVGMGALATTQLRSGRGSGRGPGRGSLGRARLRSPPHPLRATSHFEPPTVVLRRPRHAWKSWQPQAFELAGPRWYRRGRGGRGRCLVRREARGTASCGLAALWRRLRASGHEQAVGPPDAAHEFAAIRHLAAGARAGARRSTPRVSSGFERLLRAPRRWRWWASERCARAVVPVRTSWLRPRLRTAAAKRAPPIVDGRRAQPISARGAPRVASSTDAGGRHRQREARVCARAGFAGGDPHGRAARRGIRRPLARPP